MTTDTLYDTDFVLWTERQADGLRRAAREGSNLPLDWEHLAEEIEDVGNEVRNKIESLTEQIQIHLLKIACSASEQARTHWETEVDGFRTQLERQLRGNHALRARFSEMSDAQFVRSVRQAHRDFKRQGEPDPARKRLLSWQLRGITADEVREDGVYPVPGTLEFRRDTE